MITLLLIVLLITYFCFHQAFYASRRQPKVQEEFPMPPGEVYEPYHPVMRQWMREVREMPFRPMEITSFDGLKLSAKYYETKPGAPIELMFHGYRGYAERDLCGGVQRCFALEHNAFIVDQRASGDSDGNVITFGINESKDCLAWLDLLIGHFGPDVKIILTGISMGASTVLNAAGSDLPENVVGVLADCGFTSPAQIIKKVIGEMGLPANIAYPFVKLGAGLYGKFNLDEISSVDAIKNCKVPVIFFHGEDDAYVPCEMSRINYEVCPSKKRLITIPGAGHGLCYPVAPELYLQEAKNFFG
jgi:fermentation-respiration switch protein FrsA (DUF1100 family)